MSKNPDQQDVPYRLDDQIGFILRRASQRHLAIFAAAMPDLTPMQFAVLAKLFEAGAMSQNALGRRTAMDAATIKGVVDRLAARAFLKTRRDDGDRRRTIVDLSDEGRALYERLQSVARTITKETLGPLDAREKKRLVALLRRLE
ncbi:MAG: MarR family winged helix-turn-helix transcriptional regulator [Paracoccaceae bacterium]